MTNDAAAITRKIFYDDTGLDPDRVQDMVDRTLYDADEGELYLEKTRSESYSLSERKLRGEFSLSQGFGLRYSVGDSVKLAPSFQLTEAALLNASKLARTIRTAPDGSFHVREKKIIVPAAPSLYLLDDPLLGMNDLEKKTMIRSVDKYLREKDARVYDVSVNLSLEYKCVQIVRADVEPVSDVRPLVRMDIAVMLREGNKVKSGSYGFGGRLDCKTLFNQAALRHAADQALSKAEILLRARPAPAGTMQVVVGPGWAGVLLHEAVGHGLEGDFIRKRTSAFTDMVGRQVAGSEVTIVDQGDIVDRRGSLNVDDEGNKTQRNVLIEKGILRGHMQDRRNARMMGVAVTGNGRREDFQCVPYPRMTNTFAENGNRTPEEIIASVKDGIYASDFGGGSVDITSGRFNFGMNIAYPIRNGRIIEDCPYEGATLIGKGSETMMKVSMVGNDKSLDPGVGTCGKQGQGVPVGIGQPTMKLDDMVVGGPK
jgi:TldD protein